MALNPLNRSALFIPFMLLAAPASAAAPPPTTVTQQLVDAAQKDGKVVFYTSMELQTAKQIGEAFQAAYPGITVAVERNGCERMRQRLAQERGMDIRVADVID